MNNPFHIQWVEDTPRCILLFITAYGMSIGIYLSTKRNYRRREEHAVRVGAALRLLIKSTGIKYHIRIKS
jgi:hypothetical protein